MNLSVFENFGLCFFVFAKQFALITILKTIKNNPSIDSKTVIVRAQYFPLMIYTMVMVGGYCSFKDDIPEMLALRPPLPGSSDVAMTIGQVGLLTGIMVSIMLRIKFNFDYIRGFFGRDKLSFLSSALLKLGCAVVPLLICILVHKDVFNLISTFSSLLCPYFIIIVPGNQVWGSNCQFCSI